ncbi:Uncharacterized conserved protein, DUF1800 family [Stigmatella aurantiaca]|uniref:Uncharacterized conserved protein, DUF1800 family n=1 Tax=Stigmatella aurantiaca TaxID=41 RepID=A0A1H8A6W4_STIAU|nr:DUF1800 family protein [Stigmatella aurantiaca]SEM66303.1 Uncharacterized conserved protein, DUF1800 family [Stigmatella aurantiaca]
MIRRTALALALCATACAPEEFPADENAAEALRQVEQAAEPLDTPTERNAIRFLEQATFGPRLARGASPRPIDAVEQVVAVGITKSITAQVSAPRSLFDGTNDSKDLGSQFFVNAVTGQDQLRQRVAFALSQIFVVSPSGIANNAATPESEPKVAMAGFLNMLSANAFGNFRTLLEAVTKDPAMGNYLDLVNNRAFDTAGKAKEPNENYAREMLQLFTLGLHKLNENGTVQLNAEGLPTPAYTEAHVQAFSRALSGWTFAAAAGCPTIGRTNPANYTQPMIGCDANHLSTSQTLLRGAVTTAGGGAAAHLKQALDNVFADPNLPPFICKQLIQHLVTSNPSPGYVSRVVAVFKNNGNNVRGDLGAVVRKILEDDEARGPQPLVPLYTTYGRLRPPALFITSVVRWLGGTLDTSAGLDPGAKLNGWSRAMGQDVPRPPSVFSYYPPNAAAPGGMGLLGPEFAILDTATATARANVMYDMLFASSTASAGVLLDVSTLPTEPSDLVYTLGRYWIHDAMSWSLQVAVYNAITDTRAGNTLRKQRLAVYLTSLSPEYQIQR